MEAPEDEAPATTGRGLGRETALFALLTGLSRLAGLAREVAAARYFGVTGPMSAFTLAFQVPNLMRALFADQALQGGFVPVFTDLLEQGRRREAFQLATTIAALTLFALGSLCALLVLVLPLAAGVLAPGFDDDPALRDLTAHLAQLMIPTVVLFSLSGLIAGMLNALDHFSSPVAAQILWNVVIVVAIVALVPALPDDDEIYAYAIGVLVATVIQLVYPLPYLRREGALVSLPLMWRSPELRRVLRLMLPVTLTLGLFNFSLLINSLIGTLVSEQVPAAIDRAFRIVVLPQGVFSIAITTVLFPTLARLASRGDLAGLRAATAGGIRQMSLLMIPSGIALVVLAEPVTRLLYERGAFGPADTDLVAGALAIWAATLPLQGATTFMSQTFFSLQEPWVSSRLALGYVAVNAAVGLALYRPLGIEGVVLGTVVANVALTIGNALLLGRRLDGLEWGRTLADTAKMLAAGAALAVAAYAAWRGLDSLLGRSLAGQAASVTGALAAGALAYGTVALALRVEEARRLVDGARGLVGR